MMSAATAAKTNCATLSLLLSHRGRERRYELRLPDDVLTRLVLEASFKNVPLADVIASRIIAADGKGNGE